MDYTPENKDSANELYEKRYITAKKSVFKLQRLLGSKSPFISKELYSDFYEIKWLLSNQLTAYEYFGPIGKYKFSENNVHKEEVFSAWKKTDVIIDKHKTIIDKMRNYFDSLEVK